jgi:hypothetical protein
MGQFSFKNIVMKKIVFFSLMVAFMFGITSCGNYHHHQTRVVEQQFRVVEPDFFYVVKHKVVSGDTTWDRAKVYFGSGYQWTDIVAQNKFLQQPGRVWQDPVNKRWYVLIYPGEELVMGSTKVNPIFIDSIDSPVSTCKEDEDDCCFPWWGWLITALSALAVLLLAFLIWGQRGSSSSSSSSSSSTVRVDINGQDFDLATRRAILERSQGYHDRIIKVIENGADKGLLKSFFVAENPDIFMAGADFRKNQATEIKKEEDKK